MASTYRAYTELKFHGPRTRKDAYKKVVKPLPTEYVDPEWQSINASKRFFEDTLIKPLDDLPDNELLPYKKIMEKFNQDLKHEFAHIKNKPDNYFGDNNLIDIQFYDSDTAFLPSFDTILDITNLIYILFPIPGKETTVETYNITKELCKQTIVHNIKCDFTKDSTKDFTEDSSTEDSSTEDSTKDSTKDSSTETPTKKPHTYVMKTENKLADVLEPIKKYISDSESDNFPKDEEVVIHVTLYIKFVIKSLMFAAEEILNKHTRSPPFREIVFLFPGTGYKNTFPFPCTAYADSSDKANEKTVAWELCEHMNKYCKTIISKLMKVFEEEIHDLNTLSNPLQSSDGTLKAQTARMRLEMLRAKFENSRDDARLKAEYEKQMREARLNVAKGKATEAELNAVEAEAKRKIDAEILNNKEKLSKFKVDKEEKTHEDSITIIKSRTTAAKSAASAAKTKLNHLKEKQKADKEQFGLKTEILEQKLAINSENHEMKVWQQLETHVYKMKEIKARIQSRETAQTNTHDLNVARAEADQLYKNALLGLRQSDQEFKQSELSRANTNKHDIRIKDFQFKKEIKISGEEFNRMKAQFEAKQKVIMDEAKLANEREKINNKNTWDQAKLLLQERTKISDAERKLWAEEAKNNRLTDAQNLKHNLEIEKSKIKNENELIKFTAKLIQDEQFKIAKNERDEIMQQAKLNIDSQKYYAFYEKQKNDEYRKGAIHVSKKKQIDIAVNMARERLGKVTDDRAHAFAKAEIDEATALQRQYIAEKRNSALLRYDDEEQRERKETAKQMEQYKKDILMNRRDASELITKHTGIKYNLITDNDTPELKKSKMENNARKRAEELREHNKKKMASITESFRKFKEFWDRSLKATGQEFDPITFRNAWDKFFREMNDQINRYEQEARLFEADTEQYEQYEKSAKMDVDSDENDNDDDSMEGVDSDESDNDDDSMEGVEEYKGQMAQIWNYIGQLRIPNFSENIQQYMETNKLNSPTDLLNVARNMYNIMEQNYIATQQNHLKTLTSDMETLTRAAETAQAKLDEKNAFIEDVTKQLGQLEITKNAELKSVTAEFAGLNVRTKNAEEDLEKLNKEKTGLETSNRLLQENIATKDQKIETLKENIQTTLTTKEQEYKQELEAQNVNAAAEVANLKTQLDLQSAESTETQNTIDKLRKTNLMLERERQETTEKMGDAEDELQKLKNQFEITTTDITTKTDELETITNKLQKQEQQNEMMTERITNITSEKEALREEYAKRLQEATEQAINDAKSLAETASTEQNTRLQTQLAGLNREIQARDATIDTIQTEQTTLKEQIRTTEAVLTKKNTELTELKEVHEILVGDFDGTIKDLDKKINDENAYKNQIAKNEKTIREKTTENETQKEQLAALREDYDTLVNETGTRQQDLTRRIETSQKELKEKTAEYKTLESDQHAGNRELYHFHNLYFQLQMCQDSYSAEYKAIREAATNYTTPIPLFNDDGKLHSYVIVSPEDVSEQQNIDMEEQNSASGGFE